MQEQEHEQDQPDIPDGDVETGLAEPDFQQSADTDGTFEVPEVGEEVNVPPEIFSIPARDLAIAFLKGAQQAPALKGPEGNPRRGTKNQAQYIQAFVRHLSQALERI